MKRHELTEKKAARVLEWLKTEQDAFTTVKEHKGLVVIATAIDQTITVDIFTRCRLARWFDEANLKCRKEVCSWEDAMAETWPTETAEQPEEAQAA